MLETYAGWCKAEGLSPLLVTLHLLSVKPGQRLVAHKSPALRHHSSTSQAVRRRAESQQIASTAPNPTEEAVQGSTAKRKPSAKLLVKVKPASKLEKQGLSDQGFQSQKRLKVDAERPLDAGSEALTSLFSDYASDSEQ